MTRRRAECGPCRRGRATRCPGDAAPPAARGPLALGIAWALHDIEEGVAFPGTARRLAEATGVEGLRIDSRGSWIAVGAMGALVAFACIRGVRTRGRSPLYRAVVAGLEAHVWSHLAASVVLRGYSAGVVTALPVMLPGALLARRDLRAGGVPLRAADYARGAGVLVPAAILCQVLGRALSAWLGGDSGSRSGSR